MLSTVVFVPSAPLLLLGPSPLRSLCEQAVSALSGLEVIAIGAGAPAGPRTGSIDLTPFGVRGVPAVDALPLSLAVAASLLPTATLYAVEGAAAPVGAATGLLVVGDGSARRTEKAPGHFDPRAADFDAAVVSALAAGSPSALAAAPAGLGEELLAAGVPAWHSAAATCAAQAWEASVLLDDAPHGVGYVIATWTHLGS